MSKLIKKALIAVGRPRCGKKTHLQYLADQLEAPYIDMGAHLRELKTKLRLEGTERPELAPLVSTGYVADEFIMSIFRTWIGQERRLKSPFIILDGVPRNIAQARLVLPFLKHNGGFEIHTLWFTTSAKACMERPTRGERDDDSADKIVA
ncbi:MAG TPA: nucleoside monophosphate kinase, partial [Candidatus Paceibacterota bacterium]|nr:nucleoside monophosphate kinase [Candidatus Paceibacterota bacterium]